MSQEIKVNPEIVKAGMDKFGNTSELLANNAQDLVVSNECKVVPESVQAFQSALELALGRVSEVAAGTQVEFAVNAQSMWAAAQELNAVDAELATSLQKAEGIALNIVMPSGTDAGPTSNLPGTGGSSTDLR